MGKQITLVTKFYSWWLKGLHLFVNFVKKTGKLKTSSKLVYFEICKD